MTLREELTKYARDWATFPAAASAGYRHDGLRGVWTAFAERSLHRVLSYGELIVYAESLESLAPRPLPPGIRIARLGDEDWPALGAIVSPRELVRFRTLLSAGRHCLLAWRGDRVVGFGWLAERLGPDIPIAPPSMSPDAAFMWHLYVTLEERGNRVGRALTSARQELAKSLGYRETWRMIAPENNAVLRILHSGPGYRVVGRARFIQLLTRRRVRFTPALETS